MENKKSFCGGLLTFAEKPANNPGSLKEFEEHEHYGVALIEHDYPGKTPAMWNAAYRHFGIDSAVAMMVGDPAKAGDILEMLKADPKYIGGGAGVGFKDTSINYVDELDPLAKAIGAINLIEKLPSGKLKGWNTDGVGYAQSLEELLQKQGEVLHEAKIVMIGAGGTGNAIAFALAEKGAYLSIINRTVAKAEELVKRINERAGKEVARAFGEDVLSEKLLGADVVINVSTKGASGDFEKYSALAPAKLPATPENVKENLDTATQTLDAMPASIILSDVVLRNEPTPFLKQAEGKGFATLNGVPMVINQGVLAFLILHGDEIGRTEDVRNELQKVMKEAAGL